jgi:transposase
MVPCRIFPQLNRTGNERLHLKFDGETVTYFRKEEPLLRESWWDGKFIVKTNTTLPVAEVVLSYKTLMRIEQAFRQIKNFLDVGSMYHWNERRVRGHIFVCVLAYLFEQELQVLYRRALDAEITHERAAAGDDLEQRLEVLESER